MRLWHYELIQYLPKSQLIAQWRELNSIFEKEDQHILINYIYKYPKCNLFCYSMMVVNEMKKRSINIRSTKKMMNYFNRTWLHEIKHPFEKHHNERYLLQCFYNLQEKFDRGQKDFSKEQYLKLKAFVKNRIKKDSV